MKKRHNFVGYFIFIILYLSILAVTWFNGFSNINDFFTSLLLIVFFIMAFYIFLANHGIIPHSKSIKIINNIPNYLPFKHTLQNYLKNFIKKEVKIIVLIRTLDKKNYEWVLNQISAYNSIMNNPALNQDELAKVEFLFIRNNTDDVKNLIEELHTQEYDYIIISGLSAIFKDAIMSRENLTSEKKTAIKIIGSLSSINDKKIQKIVDDDDNIIRIFSPDFDEAKTAISFLFSKIKNSMCCNGECDFSKEKNNIVILHNGTYGQAIKDKCAYFFDKEIETLDLNTVSEFSVKNIDKTIKFHSFDYKHNDKLIDDKSKEEGLETFLKNYEKESVKNYFYIIGYEPNISIMLKYLDKALQRYPKVHVSLLFAGTSSMDSWRESIKNTIRKSINLVIALPKLSYYLQLHSIQDVNSIHNVTTLNLDIKHYKVNDKNIKADIIEELRNVLNRHEVEINNMLNSYWKKKNNYITTFSTDSLHIALYSIRHSKNLLESKSKVLQEYGRKTDILVNGDSINQYTVKMLEQD